MPSSRIPVVLPVTLLLAATAVFRYTPLDCTVCGLFFGGNGQWPMLEAQPFHFFYEYGPIPGYVIGVVGIVVWLVGLIFHRDIARRGFFCMMLVLLGPGLLVNGVLKPNVQRPRPCQTTEFGGRADFTPVFAIGSGLASKTVSQADETDSRHTASTTTALVCKSFPSGHASMGFATLAIPFLLRRRRKLYVLSLGLAISWGTLIGISRVVQGRHFPSDVIWAAAIVYLLAVSLYYLSGLHRVSPLVWPNYSNSNSSRRVGGGGSHKPAYEPAVMAMGETGRGVAAIQRMQSKPKGFAA